MASMRRACGWLMWLLILWAWGNCGVAGEELGRCGSALRLAPAKQDTEIPRRYAPERRVDITHVTIDVAPDFASRTIRGVTTIAFTPMVKPLTELKLDAIDLNVASVESRAKIAGYTVADKAITITFSPPVLPGDPAAVTIRYDAEPQRGLYFRTPQMGYPQSDVHLFTQGESHEAPYWYPSFDYPNERFSSEVICRVPAEMTVLSNGRLVSEQIDPATGLKVSHWLQEKPHVNYLVALVAGRFGKVESRYRNIPLAFYTPISQVEQAANSFEGTADMIAFFEQELGVPYPWEKYDQVAVADFVAGGMENTSLTILSDGTLFTKDTENIRSSEHVVSHELVHQWMGDYVTCKDWSHVWLNEGFATYYETLYGGHHSGEDAMLYGLYTTARRVTSQTDARPIVDRRYKDADDQFDYRTYSKAGWVIRMLRCQLGDPLFRRVIQTYLERHALGTVVTEDLRSIIEELSGRSFDRFFDQWLYSGGCPKLEVSYNWSEQDKLAKISVKQTQVADGGPSPYLLPTKVRFWLGEQTVDHDIVIDSAQHDFYFALHAEPSIVRFDPDLTLLAKVTFDVPKEMLYAELENRSDVVGRLLAIDALREKKEKDKKTVDKLKDVLNNDPFYGVRREAAAALQEIHTDEAFAALVESMAQSDARVRRSVVELVGGFYRPEVLTHMESVLANEKNPEIIIAAIQNIGRFHSPQTRQTISKYLQSTSYRNELADAAIGAIRKLDDPAFIPELMTTLHDGEGRFQSWDFAQGLETLACVAHDLDDRTQVREFIAGYVNHPRMAIRRGAISALGMLGDPKAIPIVETFCGSEPHDQIQRAAKEALDKLREKKPLVPDEVIELRKTVDELKKETEKLKKDLEEVKKKSEAKTEGASADSSKAEKDAQNDSEEK
jgi:aminopeptidase N